MERYTCSGEIQWRETPLTSVAALLPHSPKVDLPRERAALIRRLERSRATLWPTVRTFIFERSTSDRLRRVVKSRMATLHREHSARFEHPSQPWSRLRSKLRRFFARGGTLKRLLSYAFALLRWSAYGLCWVGLETAGRARVLSVARVEGLRIRLVEWVLKRGLELQRRVDAAEHIIDTTAQHHRYARRAAPRRRALSPASRGPKDVLTTAT